VVFKVNAASCDLGEGWERGQFRCAASTLTERLGANVIGASVYEMRVGDKRGPYHYHHGVEEWMYVISGAPIHRDPGGERTVSVSWSRLGLSSGWCRCSLLVTQREDDPVRGCLASDVSGWRDRCRPGARLLA
jgi:hypothetical protein